MKKIVTIVATMFLVVIAAIPASAQEVAAEQRCEEPALPAEVVTAVDAIRAGLVVAVEMLDGVIDRMTAEKEAGLRQASPEVEADAREVVDFIFELGIAWMQVDYVVVHLEAADVATAAEATPYIGDELQEAQQMVCALQQFTDVALVFGNLLPIAWALDDAEHIYY